MQTLKKLYRALMIAEEYIFSIAFIFLTGSIVAEVIIRKITGNSLPWLEETSRMIFMAITMVTSSVAVTSDDHPRMTALMQVLGVKKGNYMILFTDILCTLFFGFMCRYAIQATLNMRMFGTTYTSIPFDVWHTYIFFSAGFIGITFRHLARVIIDINRIRHGEDIERGEDQ